MLGIADLAFDSGAALVVDGRLVAAVAEERLCRVKHAGGHPTAAITEVLAIGGVRPADVQGVAVVGTRDWTGRLLASAVARGGGALRPLDSRRDRVTVAAYEGYLSASDRLGPLGRLDHRVATAVTRHLLDRQGVTAPLQRYDHHRCHAAASFYSSGFDRAVAVVADARGDGDRAISIHLCDQRGLWLLATTTVDASLGYLYGAATELAGYLHNSEEGKVNALAAHGGPSSLSQRLDAAFSVRGLQVHSSRPGRWRGRLSVLDYARWLGREHSPETIAWAVQHTVERLLHELVGNAMEQTGCDRLVLGGGLFLNVGVNLALAEHPQVGALHLFPAAGDSGTCVGAALLHAHPEHADPGQPLAPSPPQPLLDAYLGADFTHQQALAAVGDRPFQQPPDVAAEAAARLADRQVLAWCQGRAEHGPRALGHRSLLALPQDPDSPARLRDTVKDRPAFQPFCPSMTRQAARELLRWPDSVDPRFMIVTARARPAFARACPAAVHTDGTVRVQIVDAERAPRWHRLLTCVGEHTGLPVVLNTSLNRSGEPMCYRPEHAVALFDQTRVDALVLGDLVLSRTPAPS